MASDYDGEFSKYLAVAKNLVARVNDKADRQICTKWIQKLCNLHSDDSSVKRNRNAFFKYLLQVIEEEVIRGPAKPAVQSQCPAGNATYTVEGAQADGGDATKFLCHWSPDHRTYVACKPIPGRGALVYMAVSDDPELGWDVPGQRKQKQPDDGRA